MVPAAELGLCVGLVPGYLINMYFLAVNLCCYKPKACGLSKEHGAGHQELNWLLLHYESMY